MQFKERLNQQISQKAGRGRFGPPARVADFRAKSTDC
jgi:hypothetical protein